jgi:hypothetical protein
MGVGWGEYGDTGWGRWMRAQRTVEIGFGSRHYEREHANSCFRNFYVSAHGSFSTFKMCFHVNSHLLSLQPHKCQNQGPKRSRAQPQNFLLRASRRVR